MTHPEPLGHAIERIIERGLIQHGARIEAGTWRAACAIADDLVAEIPVLQVVEVLDHPRAASIELHTADGGVPSTMKWYAAGAHHHDDEVGHGDAPTLAGALRAALAWGTPQRATIGAHKDVERLALDVDRRATGATDRGQDA